MMPSNWSSRSFFVPISVALYLLTCPRSNMKHLLIPNSSFRVSVLHTVLAQYSSPRESWQPNTSNLLKDSHPSHILLRHSQSCSQSTHKYRDKTKCVFYFRTVSISLSVRNISLLRTLLPSLLFSPRQPSINKHKHKHAYDSLLPHSSESTPSPGALTHTH